MRLLCKINEDDRHVIDDSWKDFYLSGPNFSFDYYKQVRTPELKNRTSLIARDLLEISLYVYGADRTISRDDLGTDAWERTIELDIPVRNVDLWKSNTSLVEKMLCFLSGDDWRISFRPYCRIHNKGLEVHNLDLSCWHRADCDSICMFSGGLDSFVGAIDLLSCGKKPLFVSIHSRGKSSQPPQRVLQLYLCNQFPSINANHFMSFYAAAKNGVENTTRTRSFMFFSHAIALASIFNKPLNLFIPENGFISLNVPLTPSRIGSSSTRTTHPYYMDLFQMLINNIDIPVILINPYQFSTKGEMIINCIDFNFLCSNMSYTVSCSHPDYGRWIGDSSYHCGYCLPCTIRRAAMYRAGIKDPTEYRILNYTGALPASENITSYKYAISKFMKKYAGLYIQQSGDISSAGKISDFSKMFERGIDELSSFLHSIKRNHVL